MQKTQQEYIEHLARELRYTKHRVYRNQREMGASDACDCVLKERQRLLRYQEGLLETTIRALDQSREHLEWLIAITCELESRQML